MSGAMNPMAQAGGMGAMMGGANGQGKEQKDIFKAQVDGLELVSHSFVFANANRDVINRLNDFLKD